MKCIGERDGFVHGQFHQPSKSGQRFKSGAGQIQTDQGNTLQPVAMCERQNAFFGQCGIVQSQASEVLQAWQILQIFI
ncbi:MAG: hypothetical protein ABJ015_24390, partial [Rhodopirellula bahusiensis]